MNVYHGDLYHLQELLQECIQSSNIEEIKHKNKQVLKHINDWIAAWEYDPDY